MSRLADNTTSPHHAAPLTPAELESSLRAVDPAVLLVAPRIVRRVIKQDTGASGLVLRVPHRKTYVIDRARLREIVDPSELDVNTDDLPERVILIARPTAEMLASVPAEEALAKYWRQFFHARVHQELDRAGAAGRLTPAVVQTRIQQ